MRLCALTALALAFFHAFAAGQKEIVLLFAGDAMQHQSQLTNAFRNGSYDYSSYFKYIKDEISAADLAVVNLEVTLGGAPYTGYPQFCAPDSYAYALRDAGFNFFLNANNHILDRGSKGVLRTLDLLDAMNVRHTGVFRNGEEKSRTYPYMFMQSGIRFAFLNYTYDTNGIPVKPPVCVNLIDRQQISEDIRKARSLNADIIVANMHWGDEHQLINNREQTELANFMVAEGVDLIIGSHPHVVQPSKTLTDFRGKISHVIVYSLGNFVSGMIAPNTDGGQIVKIVLKKEPFRPVEIKSVEYALVFRNKLRRNGKFDFSVVPVSMAEKDSASSEKPSIELEAASYLKMMEFARSARKIFNQHNAGVQEYRMGKHEEKENFSNFLSIKFGN